MRYNSLDLNVKNILHIDTKVHIINKMVKEGYSLEEACRLQGYTVDYYEKSEDYLRKHIAL